MWNEGDDSSSLDGSGLRNIAIIQSGGYTPTDMLFLPRLYFLLFPPLEITAPTLWIKHLVIKDSKLNNTSVRNSGK